jgi:hypothetical protein
MRRLTLLVSLFIVIAAVSASAQPVTPTESAMVVFTPSTDHATVTSYEFGYFSVGATSPIQFTGIPKAALIAQGTDWRFPFPRLLFGGPFEHRLRACAPVSAPGTGITCSEWVVADKQTTVAPFPPSAIRVAQ